MRRASLAKKNDQDLELSGQGRRRGTLPGMTGISKDRCQGGESVFE